VAGLPSGDRPAHAANGAIEGPEGRIASDSRANADVPARAARGHILSGPITETDSLTGARTRDAGLTQLGQELDRCRRTSVLLVVVRVVAVGLQMIRASEGRDAADQLLARIARITRDHMRSYDLICRHAGDEFLCAMSNVTMSDARDRFVTIAAALADAPGAGTIRAGFAELTREQTAAELIECARCTAGRSSPPGPHQAHFVLLPEGRGEGRLAANPSPPSPERPGEAAGQN